MIGLSELKVKGHESVLLTFTDTERTDVMTSDLSSGVKHHSDISFITSEFKMNDIGVRRFILKFKHLTPPQTIRKSHPLFSFLST